MKKITRFEKEIIKLEIITILSLFILVYALCTYGINISVGDTAMIIATVLGIMLTVKVYF